MRGQKAARPATDNLVREPRAITQAAELSNCQASQPRNKLQAAQAVQERAEGAVQAWAAKITAAWRKSLEAIFEVGDLLIAAKAEIGHGQWN